MENQLLTLFPWKLSQKGVNLQKDGNEAKYNVEPMEQIYNHGFKKHDLALIESIITENVEVIIDRWKEYFNQK